MSALEPDDLPSVEDVFDEAPGDAYPEPEQTRDDGVSTITSRDQRVCEEECCAFFQEFKFLPENVSSRLKAGGMMSEEGDVRLMREQHAQYCAKGLAGLGEHFVVLDASRPWLIYWITHTLQLLARAPDPALSSRIVATLATCVDRRPRGGGWGGGVGQMSHGAPSYAAALTLVSLGTPEALASIDRARLYRWYLSLKHDSGGFRMQDDGEVDVRATYTVIAVCALLNLLTPQLTGGVAAYARRCQTFDGGFGGEPGAEAHGGYAFCALATLKILGAHEAKAADLVALERWVAARQMQFEGGFQGRANKLVDNCYSFWQGGTAAVLGHACGRGDAGIAWSAADAPRARAARAAKAAAAAEADDGSDVIEIDVSGGGGGGGDGDGGGGGGGAAGDPEDLRVDRRALQRYILLCGQQYPDGGLRDKPSKPRDFYHTCYALSGLSVAQHGLGDAPPCVWGDASNLLERVHPAFNVPLDKAHAALDHFGALPCDHEAWMAA